MFRASWKRFLAVAPLVTLLAPPAVARADSPPGTSPPVIMIMIDTLAADDMSLYGYFRPTTPNLSRFARESLTFENAYSQAAYTLASHYSLFTGLYAHRHGVTDAGSANSLSPEQKTLTEYLKAQGYVTDFVGPGNDLELNLKRGLGRAFDRQHWMPLSRLAQPQALDQEFGELFKKKFFLFFHTYWVHDPYNPTPPHDRQFDPSFPRRIETDARKFELAVRKAEPQLRPPFIFLKTRQKWLDQFNLKKRADKIHFRAMYDGAIADADEILGKFFEELRKRNLYDRAIIIVTSDHGEQFEQHGSFFHTTPYREETHIPLIMKIPGMAPRRVSQEVLSIDIMPTVLDALGLAVPGTIDGRSLLPLARGKELPARGYRFSRGYATEAIWDESWKLVLSGAGEGELFSRELDPWERDNVASRHSDIVQRLRDALSAAKSRPSR